MRRSWYSLCFGLAVTTGWPIASLTADDREPPLAPAQPTVAASQQAGSANGWVPAPAVVASPAAAEAPAGSVRRRPVSDWWRNDRPGCWSHHNYFGCGSLKSECTFIFGSCRAFFGEPCLQGPPPAFPGDYGYGSCRRCR